MYRIVSTAGRGARRTPLSARMVTDMRTRFDACEKGGSHHAARRDAGSAA